MSITIPKKETQKIKALMTLDFRSFWKNHSNLHTCTCISLKLELKGI